MAHDSLPLPEHVAAQTGIPADRHLPVVQVVRAQIDERGIADRRPRRIAEDGRAAGTDPEPSGALVQRGAVFAVEPGAVRPAPVGGIPQSGEAIGEDRPDVARDHQRHQRRAKSGSR